MHMAAHFESFIAHGGSLSKGSWTNPPLSTVNK